jgi:O-antigen ligase
LYIFIAFVVVMRAQSGMLPSATAAIVIGVLPICAFLAYRYPMIFPFGLYVALVPFDSLLAVSGGATVARLVAAATAVTMILHAIVVRRAIVPARGWYFWGAMVSYISVSLLWTSDPYGGREVTSAVVQLFLLMTVFAMYPATKTEFKIGIALFVPCGVLSAGYAVHQYLSGAISSDVGSRVELTSSGGVMLDYNYYAASFILPIAIALWFTFYGRHVLPRLASGACALFMLVGLLLTGSRGAFIASVAIVVYFAIRSRFRAQIFAFVLLAGALSVFFPSVYTRFLNDPTQQGSASGRTYIWQTGLHSLGDHWLFGNGIGSYENTYDSNLLEVYQAHFQGWSRPSHNLLVGAITELGVVGLAIVLAAWYVSFRQLKKIPKSSEFFGLRLALEGAIVGLFAMALSIDTMYIKYIWLAHSLALMLLGQVAPRRIALSQTAPAPLRE